MNNYITLEEKINNSFIEEISSLPEEYVEPVENTLDYIKKRAKCNDYEAAQIQLLMSEQSAQKTGYKYYCRYIAGQSTPEKDKADYYISIRKSWNKFLDKFANMSQDERIEAFQVHSGSEKAVEILENADEYKLDFITEKTKSHLSDLETKANELKARSKAYLMRNLKYTMKIAEAIEEDANKYFNSIIKAEIEYNTYRITDKKQVENALNVESDMDKIHSNADVDAVKVQNIINQSYGNLGPATIQGLDTGFDLGNLKKGDMLQFHVAGNSDNCFKWYVIDEKTPTEIKCTTINYTAYDYDENKVQLDNDKYSNIREIIPSIELEKKLGSATLKEKGLYHCIKTPEHNDNRAIIIITEIADSSNSKKTLETIPAKTSTVNIGTASTNVGVSSIEIIGGITMMIVGGALIKSSLAVPNPVTTPVASPVGLALFFAGLGIFVAGIVMLATSSIDLASAVSENGTHKREMLKLKKRLLNFNNY